MQKTAAQLVDALAMQALELMHKQYAYLRNDTKDARRALKNALDDAGYNYDTYARSRRSGLKREAAFDDCKTIMNVLENS